MTVWPPISKMMRQSCVGDYKRRVAVMFWVTYHAIIIDSEAATLELRGFIRDVLIPWIVITMEMLTSWQFALRMGLVIIDC